MNTEIWNFPVEKKQIFWQNDRGGFHEVKGKKAIVRTDRDKQLSVVSNGYVVVPHDDVLKHITPFVERFGEPTRSISLSKSGDKMMATYNFKKITKDVKVGDTVGFGLKAISGYDGKTAIKMAGFGLRLICLNGMASRTGFISARFQHNSADVSNIDFPSPDYFLESFEEDVKWWAALTELDVTSEDRERLEHNIRHTPGLLTDNQLNKLSTQLNGANTAWDSFNTLTHFYTHETEANEFTVHNRLRKVNEVIHTSYIDMETLMEATEELTVN